MHTSLNTNAKSQDAQPYNFKTGRSRKSYGMSPVHLKGSSCMGWGFFYLPSKKKRRIASCQWLAESITAWLNLKTLQENRMTVLDDHDPVVTVPYQADNLSYGYRHSN